MIAAHSLLWGDVTERVTLLLIASSHASWMPSALLRYKLLEFFSSLLGAKVRSCCSVETGSLHVKAALYRPLEFREDGVTLEMPQDCLVCCSVQPLIAKRPETILTRTFRRHHVE